MNELLKTDSLSRVVDGRTIVQDISVSVARGEIVAITGPSGSGKSSFLRLLNRLDEPTSGRVFIGGVDSQTLAPRELRRKLGLVLQTPFLFPGTVADNLRFGPAQHGHPIDDPTIERWLFDVGLKDYAGRNVGNLSGGEAQRVSIARTLVNEPEILLMDEPTSALDEESKEGVERLILERIRAQHLTCLIVTHDAAQATRLAGRLLLIEKGRLIEDRRLSGNGDA